MNLFERLESIYFDEDELLTVLRVAQAALADPTAREIVAEQVGLGPTRDGTSCPP
jgi:hypothetical protein